VPCLMRRKWRWQRQCDRVGTVRGCGVNISMYGMVIWQLSTHRNGSLEVKTSSERSTLTPTDVWLNDCFISCCPNIKCNNLLQTSLLLSCGVLY
jgi:hypothetical protein